MPDELTRKRFATETKTVGERSIEFVASTEAVDRDDDVISVTGWRLENFKRNPVILWAHDYSQLPVAKATRIGVDGGALKFVAEFAPASVSAFAEQVFQMVKGGFLNAVSVGFRPLKYRRNDSRGGVDFEEHELLEVSVVPVPAAPNALVVGRSAKAFDNWMKGGTDTDVLVLDDDGGDVLDIADWTEADARLSRAATRRSEPFGEIDVDPNELKGALAYAVASAVSQQRAALARLVKTETAKAIDRARGRVVD